MRVKGEAVGRVKIQAGCRRRGMMPSHTPKDRDEYQIAWQGRSWALRESCRVKVRWE
jgi:hypothetical protein